MKCGLLRIELQVPGVRSLKEKRSPLKSFLAALRNRFNCAAAEIAHQDAWQRATVGVALVAPDARHLQQQVESVRSYCGLLPDLLLLDFQVSVAEGPDPLPAFS
jgi:uncharacterized protein YlxP (DUF503 family)